jgi:hypothetical protein
MSGVRVGGRSVAALKMAWFEIGVRLNTAISTYSMVTTSPSHRDCSQQVVLSRVVQFQLTFPLGRPSSLSLRGSLDGFLLFNDGKARLAPPREISTQIPITHITMGHDPTIAWKASPTRTPPPICTSAPFLKPRWSQDRGRREQLNKYTMDDFSQCI